MSKFANPRKMWTLIGVVIVTFVVGIGLYVIYESPLPVVILAVATWVLLVVLVIRGNPKVWGFGRKPEPKQEEKRRSLFWWQDRIEK